MILDTLVHNPDDAATALRDRLERSRAPTQVATYVSGGNVAKLAAIARAERVYMGDQYRLDVLGGRSPSKAGLWVAGLGMLIFFAGFVLWAYPILNFIVQGFQHVQSGDPTPPDFQSVGLLPIGFFSALLGIFLGTIGIFMWIMSWRKRRATR